MLPKSAKHSWLSQRNCRSYCITYVLEGSIRIDLHQLLHFLHFQSPQTVQSHQVYRHRLSLPSMRRLRVLPRRSPQCIVCLSPNIEQVLDIKGVRPIIQLGRMTILPPCTAITKAVQALAFIAHHLKDLFCLHSLASSLWLPL
jgi:hypothetical protein